MIFEEGDSGSFSPNRLIVINLKCEEIVFASFRSFVQKVCLAFDVNKVVLPKINTA